MVDYQKLILPRLSGRLSPEEIHYWFEPLKWVYDPVLNHLRLICPTIFHQKKLTGAYTGVLLELATLSGRPLAGLSLSCINHKQCPEVSIEAPISPLPVPSQQLFSPLNGAHSFERFIRGPGNHLAALALANLVDGPYSLGSKSLLLTAIGPWGKTHLLDALTLALSKKKRPGLLKISTEPGWPPPTSQKWAQAEIIIIDDIHLLEHRPELQQQLIQTFDTANYRSLAMIFSAPSPPQGLTGLSDSLRSRLGGGLVLPIAAPEYELLLALADRKAADLGLTVSQEILATLSHQANGDPRRLTGFLETLAFIHRQTEFTMDDALDFLDLNQRSGSAGRLKMDMDTILCGVADAFGLKTADLTGHSRLRQAAWPRRVAMLLARELTSLTTTEIGEAFGGRDHSTVIHALKKAKQELENPNQIQMVENIKRAMLLPRKKKP